MRKKHHHPFNLLGDYTHIEILSISLFDKGLLDSHQISCKIQVLTDQPHGCNVIIKHRLTKLTAFFIIAFTLYQLSTLIRNYGDVFMQPFFQGSQDQKKALKEFC
jgi:hypothetical protein